VQVFADEARVPRSMSQAMLAARDEAARASTVASARATSPT
jgi:hypothetical protein